MANTYSRKGGASFSPDVEAELGAAVGTFEADPLGFVKFIFPWGAPTLPDGSPNPLKDKDGPEEWQAELLTELGAHVKRNQARLLLGEEIEHWRSAVSSGHGVGKSALSCWLMLWLMTTRPNTRGVATANTEAQLVDKLWPELNKWKKLALNGHWWVWTPTSLYFKPYSDGDRKNYMVTADTVSSQNTEAFQGLHNEGRAVFVLFDEASGIDDKIWEVAEGSLTDGEGFFFAFGNPTKRTGAFRECVAGKYRDLYWNRQIDSRSVRHTNKKQLEHIISKYGEDSDEARVRVYGQFPRNDDDGFLPQGLIALSMERRPEPSGAEPLILGFDIGEVRDPSVGFFRQGLDAWSRQLLRLEPVPMSVVNRGEYIAHQIIEHMQDCQPDALVIENLGPGIGVVTALRTLRYTVHAVHPGAPAATVRAGGDGKTHTTANRDSVDIVEASYQFGNERCRYNHEAREWLFAGGGLPDDAILAEQMEDLRKAIVGDGGKLFMEAKRQALLRRRNSGRAYSWASYDYWDALALTFAVKPAHIERDRRGRRVPGKRAQEWDADFNPLEF